MAYAQKVEIKSGPTSYCNNSSNRYNNLSITRLPVEISILQRVWVRIRTWMKKINLLKRIMALLKDWILWLLQAQLNASFKVVNQVVRAQNLIAQPLSWLKRRSFPATNLQFISLHQTLNIRCTPTHNSRFYPRITTTATIRTPSNNLWFRPC